MTAPKSPIAQRLARNTASLFIGQVALVGFNTALSLLIANRLGAEGLGKYAVLTAYFQIFQVLAVTGAPRLVIREMARQPGQSRSWFQRTVVTQMLGASASAFLLVLVANLLSHPADTTRALEVIALSLFPFAISTACESVFQAQEKMEFMALAQIFGRGGQVAASVAVLLLGQGIVALAWMFLLGQCLIAAVEIGIVARMRLWRHFRADLRAGVLLFRQSFDFFVLSLFVVVFTKLDILMLSQIAGEEAAGLYNAAYLVVQVVNFLSVSYGNAVYPVLSRLFSEARHRFEALLRKSLLFGMVATLLVAILLATTAEPIIDLLYRSGDYAESALLLRIEAPFAVFFMWNALLSRALMVGNIERRSVLVSGAKLGAGFIYYLALTYWLGAVGTALATVLAGLTGTILNYRFVNKEICTLDAMGLVLKPLAIGAIVLAVLWMAQGLIWPGLMIGGTLFYVLMLILFGVLSKDDMRLLWRVIRPL